MSKTKQMQRRKVVSVDMVQREDGWCESLQIQQGSSSGAAVPNGEYDLVGADVFLRYREAP